MTIRPLLVETCLAVTVLAYSAAADEPSLSKTRILERAKTESEYQVTLLPGSDSIIGDNLRNIGVTNDKDVIITRFDDYVRYKLDTPRGEQNIYRKIDDNDRVRLAFDPSIRELRVVENSLKVVLTDYSNFDTFLSSIGTYGRAFPALNRAYIAVPYNSDHDELRRRLSAHPLVREVDLVFARPDMVESSTYSIETKKTPLQSNRFSSFRRTPASNSNSAPISSYSLTGNIRITEFSPKDVSGHIFISNEGTQPYRYTDAGRYEIRLGVLSRGFSTLDDYEIVDVEDATLFELQPGAIISSSFFRLRPDVWEANQIYVLVIEITTNDGSSAFGHTTFATNHDAEPIVTCPSPGRLHDRDASGDPFYEYQWALENTGQSAFSSNGGIENEDVRMSAVRDMNLGGRNVHVAIVDTGLDICHPDLQNNIAQSQSINFRHRDWDPIDAWPHVHSSDPFNPTLIGDHGTAMAGVIGAIADNGIAIRGVAPFVWLRGFNYLSAPTRSNFLTALGSGETRHTKDVDIFNLSLGDNGTFFISSLSDVDEMNAPFAHGVTELREGRGALYVKASGNEFGDCGRPNNALVGCVSAQTDRVNSSPYVINVGGLNAAGKKAAYSNAGSNVWLTAPGGSRDDSAGGYPGLMSIDQFGLDRGFMWTRSEDHWSRDHDFNPRGSVLAPGGTSLANAVVSGAIAILLEVNPELTWRDVRHILAESARHVDSEIERVSFSNAALQQEVTTQHAWQHNEAGHAFHNFYGFGALDIDAAVALAIDYEPNSLPERVMSDWVSADNQYDVAIPDLNSRGITVSVSLDSNNLPQDATVESVELVVRMSHTFAADVQFELISPSGTVSIVSPAFNFELRQDVQSGLLYFGSNAFYEEVAQGVWLVRFRDLFARDVGSVHAAYLRIHGASESVAEN